MCLCRLAQSGLTRCLNTFIETAGSNIDFLKRTKFGVNALQLARNSKSIECVTILEKATEAAAEAAQDALLQELATEEGCKHSKHQSPGKKSKKKRSTQGTVFLRTRFAVLSSQVQQEAPFCLSYAHSTKLKLCLICVIQAPEYTCVYSRRYRG